MNSDKSPTRSRFVGQYLIVLDFKTSSLVFSAGMRWTKTICRYSLAPQPIRKFCNKSQWRHLEFG